MTHLRAPRPHAHLAELPCTWPPGGSPASHHILSPKVSVKAGRRGSPGSGLGAEITLSQGK